MKILQREATVSSVSEVSTILHMSYGTAFPARLTSRTEAVADFRELIKEEERGFSFTMKDCLE